MPFDAGMAKTLIIRKVGDIDPATGQLIGDNASVSGLLAQNMDLLWAAHEDKVVVIPRLREAFVERDAYDLVIAALGALVDQQVESVSLKLSDRVTRLMERRKSVETLIETLYEQANQTRSGGAIGPLLTTAPVTPPEAVTPEPYGPDANSPRYSGSPYYRNRRRRVG